MSESMMQVQRCENARRQGHLAALEGKNIKQVVGSERDLKVIAAYYKGYAEGLKLKKESERK